MTFEQFFAGNFPFVPFIIFKILIIAMLLLHTAFSLILVRQTKLMISVIEEKVSSVIYAASMTHLLFSVFVVIWTILFI